MDLLDRINKTAFLGKEFLTWLWFRSERQEGLFRDVPGQDTFEVWFDDKLVLDTTMDKAKETNTVCAEAPAEAAEAKAALRVGKKVAQAKLRIIKDDREWVCTVKAEELALSGVKVPALLSREEDELVLERLLLIGELEEMLDALYAAFLGIRLDGDLWPAELAAMRRWVWAEEDDALTAPAESGSVVVHLATPAADRDRALAIVRQWPEVEREFERLDTVGREAVLGGLAEFSRSKPPDRQRVSVAVQLVAVGSDLRELERQGEFGERMAARLRTDFESRLGGGVTP